MSSPSDTRLQGSYRTSLQEAYGVAILDTVTSTHKGLVTKGSSMTELRRAPNSTFMQRTAMTRSCCISPGLRRSLLLLGVFVAKRHAQLVGQIVESAISGVGKVADKVHMARMEAAAVAAAKVESAKETIQSQAALFSVQVEASTRKSIEVMEECVQ